MQTRRLGTSDLQLTTVGIGAWAMGGEWAFGWGPQDDGESVAAIHRALDLGVNWIDTAAVYGLGHAEEVVARALADRKGRVIVATKCGLRWREGGKIYGELSAQSVREEAEQSLRRLKLETIDLYQIHWPNPARQIEEAWEVMVRLQEEGKVRHAGVSNFNVGQLKRAAAIGPVASLQPPYSMLKRGAEGQLLPYCKEQGIGVVAYSPMQAGLLTGAFSAERVAALAPSDWRRNDRLFKEPQLSRALGLVELLRELAGPERTPAQLAIAWVLRRPEVTAAIVGARRPEQIEETARAAELELGEEELEQISRALDQE